MDDSNEVPKSTGLKKIPKIQIPENVDIMWLVKNTDGLGVLQVLVAKNVIPDVRSCENCNKTMRLSKSLIWRCHKCDLKKSPLAGSVFENSKTKQLPQVLLMILLYLDNMPIKTIAKRTKLNRDTVTQWAKKIRNVLFCVWAHQLSIEKIGGVGVVVEIDESAFGRNKYYRGHWKDPRWIFGGVDRLTGKGFSFIVERRDKETLLSLMELFILPGTTINCDCWPSYQESQNKDEYTEFFKRMDYKFHRVNHSIEFRSITGACTNAIESLWSHMKKLFQSSYPPNELFPGYFGLYFFQRECRDNQKLQYTDSDTFSVVLEVIADFQYFVRKKKFDPVTFPQLWSNLGKSSLTDEQKAEMLRLRKEKGQKMWQKRREKYLKREALRRVREEQKEQ